MPRFGRAQRVLAQEALCHPVQLLVVRHDQMGVAADHQPAGVDPPDRQAVELGQKDGRVHHDAIPDDGRDVFVEDAARHQLEGEGLSIDHNAVTGIVATLVADHEIHFAGKEVGQLALPLVAPLGPDHNGCGHAPLRSLCRFGLRTSVSVSEIMVGRGGPVSAPGRTGVSPRRHRAGPPDPPGVRAAGGSEGHTDTVGGGGAGRPSCGPEDQDRSRPCAGGRSGLLRTDATAVDFPWTPTEGDRWRPAPRPRARGPQRVLTRNGGGLRTGRRARRTPSLVFFFFFAPA